jgi:hypothetical protein
VLTACLQWPISGLSVSYGDVSKLVVMAIKWTYVDSAGMPPLFSNETFGFSIRGTTAIVVDNPHDPPRRWSYRLKVCMCVLCECVWVSSFDRPSRLPVCWHL